MRKPNCYSFKNFSKSTFCILLLLSFKAFSQTIDLSKAVGTTAGQASATATGGVSYTIPIEVLKGTNGMEPQVSLNYNSQSGEGIAGFGWSLAAYSCIMRSGKRFYYDGQNTPVNYTNDNDAFVLDGQHLFPISGNNGNDGTIYGTEDETFAKIESFGGDAFTGPDHFEVTTKDGKVLEYGTDATSKVLTDDNLFASYNHRVIKWYLKKVTDKSGNYIEYIYFNNQTDRDFALTEIDYTGNSTTGMLPYNKIKFAYSVITNWQNRKIFEGGATMTSPFLLSSISIYNSNGTNTKTYQCTYTTVKNQSFLTSFTETGSKGASLNPLTFQYGSNTTASDVTVSPPYGGFNGNNAFTGELTGDGKDDVIAVRYFYDNNNIPHDTAYDVVDGFYVYAGNPGLSLAYSYSIPQTFGSSVEMQGIRNLQITNIQSYIPYQAPENNDKNFVPRDYDGDGKADVLMVSSSIFNSVYTQPSNRIYTGININYSRYYNVISGPTYQNVSYSQIPHEVFSNADCKYIANGGTYFIPGDFDGDGSQDYILVLADNATTVNGYQAFFSSPKKGIVNQPIELFGVTGNRNEAYSVASTPYVVPIDFDGDGKQEILVETSTASYILKLGPPSDPADYLYMGTVVCSFTNVLAGYRVFTGDFNGDGKTDLLVRSSASDPTAAWNILYSTGTSYKSYPFYFQNRPYLDGDNGGSAHNIVIGDFNHDGKSDIWHSLDLSSTSSKHALYISNGVPLDNSNSTSVFTIYDYYASASVNKDQTFETVFGDFNFDGNPDIFSIKGTAGTIVYPEPKKEENLMVSATNGLGAMSTFNYSLGYGRSAQYDYDNPSAPLFQGANGNPYTVLKTPFYVVSSITQPYGAGQYKFTNLEYEDAMYHPLRGFLGFKKVTSMDGNTGINTISYSEMDNNFLVPYTNKTTTEQSGSLLTETDITPDIVGVNPSNPSDKRFINEVSTIKSFDYTTGAGNEKDNTYDSYGNITGVTSITGPFTGTTISPLETVTNTIGYVIANTPVPSLPGRHSVSKTRTGETSVSKTTTHTYNTSGLLSSVTDFAGEGIATTTNYNYDNFGNIVYVSIDAPNTPTPIVSNTYDSKGRYLLTKNTSGSGITKTETFAYDPLSDNISSSTSSDGLITTFEYDGFGNLTKTTLPDGNIMMNNLAWETSTGRYSNTSYRYSDNGAYEKTYYDIIGREVRKETKGFNDQLIYSTTQYNSAGLVYKQTEPQYGSESAVTVTNMYDNLQRLSSVSNGSTTTSYSYTPETGGLFKTTVTNGANQSSSKTTDATGKVVKSNDNGGELDYAYDSWGNQKDVKIGSTTLVSNTYDNYGRRTSMTDNNTGTISYEYDALGKLTKQTDANNTIHTFSYDAFGRTVSKTGPEGTTSYTYYSNAGKVDDNLSNITTSSSDPSFATEVKNFQYDNLQRLSSESTTVGGQTFTQSYQYDANDNLSKTTYASQLAINDTYDKNGILTATSMTYGGVTQNLFTATAMNSRGVYTGYTYGNGKSSTVNYDLVKGVPTRYYTSGIQDLNLSYDVNTTNLLSRNDAIKGLTENFTYDNLNRLTGSSVNDVQQFTMTYDNNSGNSLGNIQTKSDIGNYTYDINKINAVRFLTTNTGTPTDPPNVISTNTRSITYTPFLKASTINEVENGYELSYLYGENYQRIKSVLKQGSTTLETKYYLGNYEKLMKNGITSEIHYADAGNGLCAIIVVQGGVATPYFAYSDQLGSPLTFTNSSGTVVAQQNFDAWGRHRNPNNWTYSGVTANPDWLYRGYTGHEDMSQFSLINMNGRIYDPVTCRMLSPDNFIPLPWNTQGYDRYGYANNNPLSYVDPDGNFIWFLPLIGTAIGAITGGTIAASHGQSFFKGAVTGGIIGASLGMGISNIAKPELINGSFLWRAASSGLTDGSINILSTMETHGSLNDMFRNGLIGIFSGVTGAYIGDVVKQKWLDNLPVDIDLNPANFGRMVGNTLNGFLRRGGDALSKHNRYWILHAIYGGTDGLISSLVSEEMINTDNSDIRKGYIANLESSVMGSVSGMGPLLIQLGGEYIPGIMALAPGPLNFWKRLGLATLSDLMLNIRLDVHFKSINYPFFLGGDFSHIYRSLKLIDTGWW